MWAIRILSGPQAGKIIPLKSGTNMVGRAPTCDVKVISPGVSKEHIKIDVLQDKIIVSDLGSRNGTFVNGTQVKSTKIKPGDRIGLNEVVLEIVPLAAAAPALQIPASNGNLAYQLPPPTGGGSVGGGPFALPEDMDRSRTQYPNPTPVTSGGAVQEYLDRVVLPGVYRLAELIEFKWLLGMFMGAFILLTTSLSTIPLIRILRDSVEQQSQQHALTIAAALARTNEAAIREGTFTAINMSTAQRVGVLEALIINKVDGKIIAPASKAESYSDLPFVHEARNYDKESVKQIDGDTVVALYPISAYNPETGATGTLAYAVIQYDMSSLAVDDSKTISLFVITLAIATALGGLVFFFLYKLIEFPVNSLNAQLSNALREGRDDVKVTFQFEPLSRLSTNINSALTRAMTGSDAGPVGGIEHDRRLEMNNIIEMVGFAGIVISAIDRTIVSVNQAFEERTHLSSAQLLNQPVQNMSDQALKLNLIDLLDRLEGNPDQLATSELEFGGQNCQFIAQAIFGTSKIAYFIVILVPGGDA